LAGLIGYISLNNNGTNWTAVNNGLTITYVSDLAVGGTDLFAGTDDGVYLSTIMEPAGLRQ